MMYDAPPFSGPNERWAEISDFPLYAVSDHGRVIRIDAQRLITPTKNQHGVAIVGLMRNNTQCKRALALLVATAFVPPSSHPAFDTPINLDGDRSNNHFSNLMWRPLWFARRYVRQFFDDHTTYNAPIEDVETGQTYSDSMSASIHHGILDYEIVLSMMNNSYVLPTGQVFRKVMPRQIP